MRKGRFGVVLCLYPILAFTGVILHQPLLCALFFLLPFWRNGTSGQLPVPSGPGAGAGLLRLGRILNGVGSLLPDYTTLALRFLHGVRPGVQPGVPGGHRAFHRGHRPGAEGPGGGPPWVLRPGLPGLREAIDIRIARLPGADAAALHPWAASLPAPGPCPPAKRSLRPAASGRSPGLTKT